MQGMTAEPDYLERLVERYVTTQKALEREYWWRALAAKGIAWFCVIFVLGLLGTACVQTVRQQYREMEAQRD